MAPRHLLTQKSQCYKLFINDVAMLMFTRRSALCLEVFGGALVGVTAGLASRQLIFRWK